MSPKRTSCPSSPNGPASRSSAWRQAEAEKLLKMESELKGKVIGQDEAVIAISKALRRSRADLKDPRRPIGSFLFLGPTGVGKTFLAKNLAEFMFGTAEALIQIDMSEYMEKHTASRLIGAPPGYVGYEEGGQLSEAVRRRPYSVILFDEVEKAHPDVMHLLLQILEEGQVTDNFGRKIDFRNTIVILTSNVGAEQIKRQTSLGFMPPCSRTAPTTPASRARSTSPRRSSSSPSSSTVWMTSSSSRCWRKTQLNVIVDLEVAKVVARLKKKNIHITLDDTAREFLMKEGFDPQYGARPMRRAVEKNIEDPLAEHLLRGDVNHLLRPR
jgi:ATP-dependent Clp protease ATP-binding subunit ClpC